MLRELNSDLEEIVTRVRRSLVHVHNGRRGAGSGTIWHADGLVVTNAHVVGHGPVKVELPDGRTFPAQILARDTEQDLAALRLEGAGIADLPTIQLGDSRALRAGRMGHRAGASLGRGRGRDRGNRHRHERSPAGDAGQRARLDLAQPASAAGAFGRPVGGRSGAAGGHQHHDQRPGCGGCHPDARRDCVPQRGACEAIARPPDIDQAKRGEARSIRASPRSFSPSVVGTLLPVHLDIVQLDDIGSSSVISSA